jgi:outer membrane murein-binding lipoprotein Lpp
MGFPADIRLRAIIRDQARCRHCSVCERDADLEVHHIVPEIRGGNDRLSNAATLCIDCHMETHGHMWTESTTFSETDIDRERANELLYRKADLLEQRDEKIAELQNDLDEKAAELQAAQDRSVSEYEQQINSLQERFNVEADRRRELVAEVSTLREKNNNLAQQVSDLRERVAQLKAKRDDLRSKETVPQERHNRVREEHKLMYNVLWEKAEPPVPAEESGNSDATRVEGLFSKLNPLV